MPRELEGKMIFIAHERGICTNCNKDRGPTLKCQSCGWIDPPTIRIKEETKTAKGETNGKRI